MRHFKFESDYQKYLIEQIEKLLPGSFVLKNDPNIRQGYPDLSIHYRGYFALLECKISEDADRQPNQEWYINDVNETGGFSSFIFPEIEKEVLNNLLLYFTNRIFNDEIRSI